MPITFEGLKDAKLSQSHVTDGRKTYFYDTGKKSSSWCLPPSDIEKLISFHHERRTSEARTLSRTMSARPLSRTLSSRSGTGVPRDIVTGSLNSNMDFSYDIPEEEEDDDDGDSESENNSVIKDRWTVKLHVDTGQPYYCDALVNTCTWDNPFAVNEWTGVTDQIALDAQNSKISTDDAAKLAGFDLVPNPAIFKSKYVESTTERISAWLDRNNFTLSEDYSPMLTYPEYIHVDRDLKEFTQPLKFHLRIHRSDDVDSLGDEHLSAITTMQGLQNTVGDLLANLFKKYSIRKGESLDENGIEGYVFKLDGFHEYFLHPDFKLGYYDAAVNASRDNETLHLTLVKLMPAELMDVGSILQKNEDDYRKPPVNSSDDWTKDEIVLAAENSKASPDSQLTNILKSSIIWPFRVLVQGVSNCPQEIACDYLQVELNLYFNGESLIPTNSSNVAKAGSQNVKSSGAVSESGLSTTAVPFSADPRFPHKWLDTKLEVAALPATTRVAFSLVGVTKGVSGSQDTRQVIAGASVTLIDYCRRMVSGEMILNMFPHQSLQVARDPLKFSKGEAGPELLNLACGVPGGNGESNAGSLHILFEAYSVPVIGEMITLDEVIEQEAINKAYELTPNLHIDIPADRIQIIHNIGKKDALYDLTTEDKFILWKYRNYCSKYPALLSKFLLSLNWSSPPYVMEAHRYLTLWAKPTPTQAIGMLDIRYSDPVVREYAVRILDELDDSVFQDLMLQLVQVLKYEAFHDSPLSRLLLRRALRSPLVLGHHLFWMLRSEMECTGVLERFGTILYLYVIHCGPHEDSLRKQCFVNDKIKVIADQIKTISSRERRIEAARSELEFLDANLPSKFCLCLTPRIEVRGIKSKKCKVMDSKKLPLWIVFENADPNGKDFYTIFKSGDDLRQDQITLQLLRIMDLIWKGLDTGTSHVNENPLDLQLKPYKCCSTGKDLGMIEVVVNSDTTANIMSGYGGKLTGAFSYTPIDLYIQEHNAGSAKYKLAVEHFVRSCAGYCVATFVLGIGDRHAGNIMVAQSGHLFHIDFGHFLGNFKSKYGFKRERAPFVFTPGMAYVMRDPKIKGATYTDFERMCANAFNMLRRRADLFINLFILMVPAAMPELLERSDISYLREMMHLELTTAQADSLFIAEIKNSLSTVSRSIDNMFHLMKH